jgi:hypothetical protein
VVANTTVASTAPARLVTVVLDDLAMDISIPPPATWLVAIGWLRTGALPAVLRWRPDRLPQPAAGLSGRLDLIPELKVQLAPET